MATILKLSCLPVKALITSQHVLAISFRLNQDR